VTTAIRTELLKVRTTRLVLGISGVAVGLTVLGAVISAARAGGSESGSTTIPSLATETGLRAIVSFTGFGLLMALVLGITVASGEFRYRTASATYIDEPNRTRILGAKLIAAAATGALLGAAIAVLATGIGLAFAAAKGYEIALTTGTIARFAAGATLGAALLATLGVGVGSLLRSQLAALIAVFLWGLAVEQIAGGISPSLGAYLPITAASTMAGATSTGAMPPIPSDLDPLPFAAVAALLAATAGVTAFVAARTAVRRDIT
jgi:ABC-type transport system involved in multi-copper enzyme maturation permease subunit